MSGETEEELEELEEMSHENKLRLITFHMDGETYGVEVCRVREILRLGKSFPVPGAPHFVIGITNIRGSVVTIIDARKRFSLPDVEYTDTARMIVLESGEELAAIVVDRVSDVKDIARSSVDMNPKINMDRDSQFINGVITTNEGIIIFLNVDAVLEDEQMAMVSGF